MSPNEQPDPLPTIKRPKALTVKVGTVSVKVYPMGDGRWCIAYRLAKGGPRQRILRKSLADAKARATELCTEIQNGETAAGSLSPQQRLEAVTAARFAQALGLALDANARDVAEAHKLTAGATIMEMARFWARHHGATSGKTAVEVHQELLASKAPLGAEQGLHAPARKRPRAVRARVQGFDARGDRRRGNREISPDVRRRLVSLQQPAFADRDAVPLREKPRLFAAGSRHRSRTGADALQTAQHSPPRVFTPEELRIALDHVQPSWRPWLVLGAFTGLRMAEIGRLEWRTFFSTTRSSISPKKWPSARRARSAMCATCRCPRTCSRGCGHGKDTRVVWLRTNVAITRNSVWRSFCPGASGAKIPAP